MTSALDEEADEEADEEVDEEVDVWRCEWMMGTMDDRG